MSQRRIDEIFDGLSNKSPFFAELEERMKLNSIWREMVGDFLASKTHVSSGGNGILRIWSKDSSILSEMRFRSGQILDEFKRRGLNFKRIRVSRS